MPDWRTRMNEVVIVEAVRSPIGRRGGGLSSMHSIDLLGALQREVLARAGVDPNEVGQVVGGCGGQDGKPACGTRRVEVDEGVPEPTPDGLGGLRSTGRPAVVHRGGM